MYYLLLIICKLLLLIIYIISMYVCIYEASDEAGEVGGGQIV